MNVHTPQRINGESRDNYRIRRIESKRAVRSITHPVNLGTPRDFRLHKASEERALRRKLVRMSGGIRQFKRQERNANLFAREFGSA